MGKYGGDYTKARSELAAKVRPTTLAAVDKLYLEHQNTLADISKKRIDAKKITAELDDAEREAFGGIAMDIAGRNYNPTAFEAALSVLERTHPDYRDQIQKIRGDIGQDYWREGPGGVKSLIDSLITPKARAAAAELKNKAVQAQEGEQKLLTEAQKLQEANLKAAAVTVPDNAEEWPAWYAGLDANTKRYVPANYSKAAYDKVQRMGLTRAEFLTAEGQAATREETRRANEAAEVDRDLSRGVTERGQNLVDARTRELAELTREAQRLERENKPPTEAMRTVATYAARMEQAEQTFDAIPTINAWNNNVPNWAQTAKGQQFDQATRNFINATLRRESGAAISSSEFENAYEQYIPQPGDKAEKLKLKAQNRAIVRESFKSAAGKAYESPQELLKKSAAAGHQGPSKTYKKTAVGPGGQQLGTDDVGPDGKPPSTAVWYDVQTGRRVN
jgi:hypothetical protein